MDRQLKEVGSLQYISTAPFNTFFWTYTITRGPSPQFTQTGSLVNVVGANSTNCPAGHVLRPNGKKLYPPAYPGGPSPYPNIKSYMIGVFDIRSGLSGYINPNDSVFAPFNKDRPTYLPDSFETSNNTTLNLGPSVLTLGNVTAVDLTILGNMSIQGKISPRIINLVTPSFGDITIDASLGQVFSLGPLIDSLGLKLNITTAASQAGAIIYLIITGSTDPLLTRAVGPAGTSPNVFFASNIGMNIAPNKKATMTFVCDGISLYEVSRTNSY